MLRTAIFVVLGGFFCSEVLTLGHVFPGQVCIYCSCDHEGMEGIQMASHKEKRTRRVSRCFAGTKDLESVLRALIQAHRT